jgi:hypothetical protein
MGAKMTDLQLLMQAGINPKTGLPMKFGGSKVALKEDTKKLLRIVDEQDAVNRYVWYNLPCNITSQELERLLYYKGREDEGMQLIKKASKRKGVWKTNAELFLLDNDSSAEDVPSEAIPVPDEELETVVEPTSPSASPKRQSRHKKKSGSRKKKGGIIKSIKRFLWKVFR